MSRVSLLLLLVLALGACENDPIQGPVPVCDPVPEAIVPASGPSAGGTEVTVSGLFVAADNIRDVAVRVGSSDATIVSVDRQGCGACDACAAESLRCASCDRECRGLAEYLHNDGLLHEASRCEEALVFVTPPGAQGAAVVSIVNGRGQTAALTFEYEALPTGDDDDSGGDDDDSASD